MDAMSASKRTAADDAVDKLRRRIKPAGIVVELADGKKQSVDLLDRRGRWERVKKFLDLNPWNAIACYADVKCNDGYLDTIVNPEAEEPTADDGAAVEDSPEERLRRTFETTALHIDRMVAHIRGHDAEFENSRTAFTNSLTEQFILLQTRYQELEARHQEAMRIIEELRLARVESGDTMSEKEKAIFGLVDAVGQKFGLPSMGMLRQLGAPGQAQAGAPAKPAEGGEL